MGDGEVDLVTNFNHLSVFPGRGDGTFKPPITSSAGYAAGSAFVAADFNGDGKIDLATSDFAGRVTQLLNAGGGMFQSGQEIQGQRALTLTAADFNADGHADLVLGGGDKNGEGYMSIWLGNGDGTFTRGRIRCQGGMVCLLDSSRLEPGWIFRSLGH